MEWAALLILAALELLFTFVGYAAVFIKVRIRLCYLFKVAKVSVSEKLLVRGSVICCIRILLAQDEWPRLYAAQFLSYG